MIPTQACYEAVKAIKKQAYWLFFLCCFTYAQTHAQGYIEHSRVIGGSAGQAAIDLIVDNGYSYVLGNIGAANDYLITVGPTAPATGTKSTLTKLDPSGKVVWSRYLPYGSGATVTNYAKLILQNGILYTVGSSNATDVPVTNGSVAGGGGNDILFTKIDATNGAILHNGYLGGSGADATGIDIAVENGNVFISYTTTSPNIPVTTGPAFISGSDHIIQKLDASGNIVYSTYIGGMGSTIVPLKVENGMAYLAAPVGPVNHFVTTDGSSANGVLNYALLRLDASGNRSLATIFGGSGNETAPVLEVNNGEMYLTGFTSSTNYPVTDGSTFQGITAVVLTKINSSGKIVFSGYRGGITGFQPLSPKIAFKNNALYLFYPSSSGQPTITTTDVSIGGSALIKINPANGATLFATKLGEIRTVSTTNITVDMAIDDNAIYAISTRHNGSGVSGGAFVTDGSTATGRGGTFVTKHTLDGQLLFASFLAVTGGAAGPRDYFVAAENGKMYVAGSTLMSSTFPVTDTRIGPAMVPTGNDQDLTWTVYNFCPAILTTNTISPLTQTTCQNGLVQQLTGNEVIPSAPVPLIYINGTPKQQIQAGPRYQWQSSTTASGPWTNISTGTQKDYVPATGAQTLYYRRLVLPPLGCGEDPVSTSAIAAVTVGANASPTVTSQVFNTCAGTPVNISLTASGGLAPYTYAWDNGIASITNTATVTPASNSVYTMTATDANGCQQIAQAIVNAYVADAGPASVSSCAGKPVRIGTTPPAGLSGVTYSWAPIAGLDDPTAAQPLATPGATTIYTLQMTIPISGSGTCTTTDNITVNVVAGPVTANFAGLDKAICKGGTVNLGTTTEAGFTYTWAPGAFLSAVTGSTTTFNPGTNIPQPNPSVYTLTATKNGCAFTDQVAVAVLAVDAGEDYCGPRTVGTPDKMPGVTGKTYLWEVVSGPGTITGATNTPTTTVSASTSNTTYRVTVSYLGASCSDDVVVNPCSSGGCPMVDIDTVATQGCPNTAFGQVALRANPDLSANGWTYTWSSMPAGGLSATTGTSVTLTNNIERDITLTVSRIDNPAVNCSKTIHVNNPSWSLPVFNVPDKATCPSTPVSIGTTAVAGYSYTWQNVSTADVHSSNPSVSPAANTRYTVSVEDAGSGCVRRDTVNVTVKPLIVNPGPDWVACSNALITLGSAAQPGYTYSWVPQVAAYQNGTSYQSAQPQVLIATTQAFTLTVTDTESGCTKDSTITITIDPSNTLPPMTNQTICPGGSAKIGLPAMTGVTYSWSPATGLSSTTVAQPMASPASTQVYTLSITYYDANGAPACTKTGNVTVTVAAPQITMSDATVCPSAALYNLSNGVTVTGATSYSWEPGAQVTNPNTLSTTVIVNPHTPTTFTLTAKDANGCSVSASKVVSPTNAAPKAGNPGFLCVGASKTLGNAANTGTLTWTISPAIAGTLTPANGAEPVFTPAAADAGKTFTFTITQNISGCINTDAVDVAVKTIALPTMPVQTVCSNTSLTIGVPAQQGVSYAWSPATGLSDPTGSMTIVNGITSSTKYKLTAVDAFGCSASGDAVIGVNPAIAPTVSVPDVVVGAGTSGIPFSPQISPTPANYTYTWSPPATLDNPYIANAKATPGNVGTTSYTLSVTGANGCTNTAQAKLNVVSFATNADLITVKTLKDAAKTNYVPGEDVAYTITVINNGPGDAYNVNISDVAPTGTTISSWTAVVTSGTLILPHSSGTGDVNETIVTFPAGATVTYEVTVKTTPSFTTPLSNTATITASNPDPDPACPACTTPPLPKAAIADIVTVKTLKNTAQTQFAAGQQVVYTITVTNNGPDDAANVTITDNAPAGTTIANWSATVQSGVVTLPNTSGTGNLNETINSFPNGAVVVYEVAVLTPETFTGNLINTAQATTISIDPDPTCVGCTAPSVSPLPAPVAVNNDTTTKESTAITIRVLGNDSPGPSGSPLVPTTLEIVSQPAHGTVTVNGDGTVVYTPTPGYTGTDVFTYRVQDENGVWSNVATVTITILKDEIQVSNVITANGDGKNDKLIIRGLEKYQRNTLLIFNRWNNKVYESQNYTGNWDGKVLNAGTYFYTLKLQDVNGQWHTVNGYITLIR